MYNCILWPKRGRFDSWYVLTWDTKHSLPQLEQQNNMDKQGNLNNHCGNGYEIDSFNTGIYIDILKISFIFMFTVEIQTLEMSEVL